MSRTKIEGFEQYDAFTLHPEVAALNAAYLTVWPTIAPVVQYVLTAMPRWTLRATKVKESEIYMVHVYSNGESMASIGREYIGWRVGDAGVVRSNMIQLGARGRRNYTFSKNPKKLLKDVKEWIKAPVARDLAATAVSTAHQRVSRQRDRLLAQAKDALKLDDARALHFARKNYEMYAAFSGADVAVYEEKKAAVKAWDENVGNVNKGMVVRYSADYDTIVTSVALSATDSRVAEYLTLETPEHILNAVRMLSIMPEFTVVEEVGIRLTKDVFMLFNQGEAK